MKLPWWLPIGSAPVVAPQELKLWMDEGRPLQFVDARTDAEYRQGTIGNAVHTPLTGMPASIESVTLDPTVPVVVLCLSGHRSLPGTRWLRRNGYQAYSLHGGVMAWRQAGYSVKKTKNKT